MGGIVQRQGFPSSTGDRGPDLMCPFVDYKRVQSLNLIRSRKTFMFGRVGRGSVEGSGKPVSPERRTREDVEENVKNTFYESREH